VSDLKRFEVQKVFLKGELAAQNGVYSAPVIRVNDSAVRSSFHVADFDANRLVLPLKTGRVHVIDMMPGSIVTKNTIATVARDAQGNFIYTSGTDIVKIAVIERHHATGNVGIGLIRGYGIRRGAAAISIAHDSHNIIALGTNDADMVVAVEALIAQGGGMALALDAKIIAALPLPIGGIMSDQSGEWVAATLAAVHAAAHRQLGVPEDIEPLMSLSFMALPVIPEVKITDRGLFDVSAFKFIAIDA
jgi:adenine deaminase